MSLTSTETAHNPFANNPDYYAGRADASHTRTVDQMVVLMGAAIDYASIAYASGFSDRVTELRLELDVVAAAESELAQTTLARKQGRETSSLHTSRRRQTRTHGRAA
ncbi:hypothetical protein [Streptomyces sp. NPDC007991]|uniref:hypothetical protein n=1 Tax=Streptomyces sp. NPDC007991 TaxID=3364803 RepID=UPI0036E134F6